MVIGMDQDLIQSQGRLESYSASLSEVIGHADPVGPLGDYCHGLLLPLDRKSVEPLAAAVAPRGLDRGQHRPSQEGQALGRRCAAVLRPVGQAGQTYRLEGADLSV